MATIREINTLPLARSTVDELYRHGFRVVSDFRGLKPLDLCKEVKSLTPEQALQILQTVSKSDSENTENLANVALIGGIVGAVDLSVTAKVTIDMWHVTHYVYMVHTRYCIHTQLLKYHTQV
ncbi:hypothetical protein EON63_22835 [archaeon]|nr:MAG: hypothetical protein EON63_22835 [archaeon]